MLAKPLARIWKTIAYALDGNVTVLATEGLLTWLPAHQTFAGVGVRELSKGHKMSVLDWRANRLVDALAKQAAAKHQLPAAIVRRLDSATCATKHAAMLLGQVTHAANNHRVEVVDSNGIASTKLMRDAVPMPLGRKRKAACLDVTCCAPVPGPAISVRPWRAGRAAVHPRRVRRKTSTSRIAIAHDDEAALLRRRVVEIGSSCVQPTGVPSAASRLELVLAKVKARAAAAVAQG